MRRRGCARYHPALRLAAALSGVVLLAAAVAQAQPRHRRERHQAEPAAVPPVAVDKRDSLVTQADGFNGKPYWLALAECGGIYFQLNRLYAEAAVQTRVVKPDPHANAEYSRKLTEAIRTATVFFDGAEHVLTSERGLDRNDAVLTYDAYSQAAGVRLRTIDAALAAAKACPVLYQACQAAHPKECSEPLVPIG